MSADPRTRLRLFLVACLYVLAILWGLCAALPSAGNGLHLLLSATIGCVMTGWCVVDSQIRRRPVLRTFYFLIFCFWLLGVPCYLIWSRKWRGLVPLCIHGLGICGLAFGVFYLASANLSYARQAAYDGYLAIQHQDYDLAVSRLESAVAAKDDEPDWWYNLGIAYQAQGDISSAIDAVEKGCSLDPTNREFKAWLEKLRAQKAPSTGHP